MNDRYLLFSSGLQLVAIDTRTWTAHLKVDSTAAFCGLIWNDYLFAPNKDKIEVWSLQKKTLLYSINLNFTLAMDVDKMFADGTQFCVVRNTNTGAHVTVFDFYHKDPEEFSEQMERSGEKLALKKMEYMKGGQVQNSGQTFLLFDIKT